MQHTQLGRTGLLVSRLCLGTMNFGWTTEPAPSFKIMDAALDHGVNFFDTANGYGRPVRGATESILGDWFSQGGGRRHKVVLATKVYGEMGTWPNESKLSALNIRRALDASLTRLKTDYVDLYQMHHVDRATPWEEIWQAMELAVQQGKVLYVGSSNFAGWHIAKAQGVAKARNFLGLVSEQSIYNLFERTVELEVLPAAMDFGLGVIPWSPLHGGALAGAIAKEGKTARIAEGRAAEFLKSHRPQIEKYEALCANIGQDPADVALAWLLHQPAVTAPIIGPRTMEQFLGNLKSLEVKLDGETLKALNAIFPGHKHAPEDYAW
jgi:aryl-alcohol dehydrogenase-like predicted oxidoreductase